ncbi:MAG: hypothetical protein RI958_1113 [Actinomycetota bacterium]|jgi:hypothetical protein
MDDVDVIGRISRLLDEEHAIERSALHRRTHDERVRLRQIEATLDQCWDLLRQRRARQRVGRDPDEAIERPVVVVERYEQ